jgi:hypothetical protein
MDSYLPLLSIASLAGPETAGRLTDYAVAVREEKRLKTARAANIWFLTPPKSKDSCK